MSRCRRVSMSRLIDLAETLNDTEGTELGPLDRMDLREAVIELMAARQNNKAPPKPQEQPA